MTVDLIAPPPAGYVDKLDAAGFSPGWAKRKPQMWPQPAPVYVPAVWRYSEALQALHESTSFVSTELAERRNLIMVNPILDNIYPSCGNLVAAYQLVLPGETARSHRHTPNALRLVLDAAPGLYTLVDGARVDMAEGDVVLTPQWHWHGHANHSDAPAFWVDFLDVPLVQKLENMYFEHHPDTLEAVREHPTHSSFRYRGKALLDAVSGQGEIEVGDGQLPTIGLHLVGLAAGETRRPSDRIANHIVAITSGTLTIEADRIGRTELTRGDVAVIPAWFDYSLEGGNAGATMLRVTDEPVYAKLGFRDVAV